MSVRVTVGIPCFNSRRWLAGAVESALAQTGESCEVLVVDDGSTDGSLEVARSFGDSVRVFQTAHAGGNHARNVALREARGEWLQFLDADDYLEPSKIRQQFAETDNGADADAIYSPYWFERYGESNPERWISELDPRLDHFGQWLAWQFPQTGAVLWRKSSLKSLGGWNESQPCCQEHELYLRALKRGLRFVFASTAGAVYRLWSEETVCRKNPRETIRVKTALLDDARSWLTQRGRWKKEYQEITARACFEMSRTLARYDLAAAIRYHDERRSKDLIEATGPAAPLLYRVAYGLLGFRGAERVATMQRGRQ